MLERNPFATQELALRERRRLHRDLAGISAQKGYIALTFNGLRVLFRHSVEMNTAGRRRHGRHGDQGGARG
jgi:hypothetical protein